MEGLEAIDGVLRLIDTGGTIGLLLLLVYLSFTGRLVSVALLEKVIAQVVREVLDDLENRGKL